MSRQQHSTRHRSSRPVPQRLAASMVVCAALLGPTPDAAGQGLEIGSPEGGLSFYAHRNGTTPSGQLHRTISLTNTGEAAVDWAASSDQPWIWFPSNSGSVGPGETVPVVVAVDPSKAPLDIQSGPLWIWDSASETLVGTIDVRLRMCETTCLFVDAASTMHTVSPLLFGNQVEWLNSGGFLWNRLPGETCESPLLTGGAPRPELMSELKELGSRLMRYPAGITADFFQWREAIGPIGSRVPQINPFWSSIDRIERQCPVYGPDENADVAVELGVDVLTTANVSSGTPQDTAGLLVHYRQRGIPAEYWELGNENYLPGFPVGDPAGTPYYFAAAYLPGAQYAGRFDEHALALRAVDPNVKIGFIAQPYQTTWNREAFSAITQRADFVTVHLFQPLGCSRFQPAPSVFQALLGSTEFLKAQLADVKAQLAQHATAANQNLNIGVTEHGTLFGCGGAVRNRTLASALFSALNFNMFMRDPRIVLANHLHLVHATDQAAVTNAFFVPLRTPFFDVFRLYSQASGGTATESRLFGVPTFSTDRVGVVPAFSNLPMLDTAAVTSPDGSTLRVFVVNRSLTTDVPVHIALDGLPGAIQSFTVARLDGPSYDSVNSWVAPKTVQLTTVPAGTDSELEVLFPAHSLTVFIVSVAPPAPATP